MHTSHRLLSYIVCCGAPLIIKPWLRHSFLQPAVRTTFSVQGDIDNSNLKCEHNVDPPLMIKCERHAGPYVYSHV